MKCSLVFTLKLFLQIKIYLNILGLKCPTSNQNTKVVNSQVQKLRNGTGETTTTSPRIHGHGHPNVMMDSIFTYHEETVFTNT
jgi:hypothetical protein